MPDAAINPQRPVAYWLIACAALIFCIVVVGGITRLTRSGLSIVEWKPIAGTLPPIGAAEWDVEFAKYRETPEYKLVNRGMGLDEFKNIFWWEYVHRVLARLIGVAFLLPFLWFLFRKKIRGYMAGKLFIIFLLGGLQGFVGWYMVKSGLVKDPHVSHLRLMTHLLLAMVLYGTLLYTAWQFLKPVATAGRKNRWEWLTVGVTFLLLASGALVAGLKAGKMYNTFPLMNGHYVPPGVMSLSPVAANFIDNPVMVQFVHRNIAYALGVLIAGQLYLRRRDIRRVNYKHPAVAFLAAYLLQVLLGVLTLLNAVPVFLGALHQANAMLLFSAALYAAFRAARVEK